MTGRRALLPGTRDVPRFPENSCETGIFRGGKAPRVGCHSNYALGMCARERRVLQLSALDADDRARARCHRTTKAADQALAACSSLGHPETFHHPRLRWFEDESVTKNLPLARATVCALVLERRARWST